MCQGFHRGLGLGPSLSTHLFLSCSAPGAVSTSLACLEFTLSSLGQLHRSLQGVAVSIVGQLFREKFRLC